MENNILSDWIIIDGYCATRVYYGTDHNEVKNRVAFIEKSGRVRIAPYTDRDSDSNKWEFVCRGSSEYGMDEETREDCDIKLKELGYTFK